jgi:aquaporin related protein
MCECWLTLPKGIGLSLFVAEMTGVFFTGGSLNPARSFGPAVINSSFVHYHWIYWLGPTLGSIVAAGFYKFIKILEYETANPDQDAANNTHTSLLQNRKDLLMAAGLSEADAEEVASGLQGPDPSMKSGDHGSEKTVVAANLNGGPDGKVVANGQGRSSEEHDQVGPMYGTGFRADSAATNTTAATASSSPGMNTDLMEETPAPPQRPAPDAGAVGRYSHLAKHSKKPHKFTKMPLRALGYRDRINSPRAATNDEVHFGSTEEDVALGGGVVSRVMNRPKKRLNRTGSGGV